MVSFGKTVAQIEPLQRTSPILRKEDIKMEPDAALNPDNQGYQLIPRPYCLLCQKIFLMKGLLREHFRTTHAELPVGQELLEEDDIDDDDSDEEIHNAHGKEEEEDDDMEEADDEEEDVKPDINGDYYASEIFQQNPYEHTNLYKKTNDWVKKNLMETDLWPHYVVEADEHCPDLKKEYKIKRREAAKLGMESDDDEDEDPAPKKKRKPRKKSASPVKKKRPTAAAATNVSKPKKKKTEADDGTEITREMIEMAASVRVSLFRCDYRLCNICDKTFLSTESYMKHRHEVSLAEVERLEREEPVVVLLDRCDDLIRAYTRSRDVAVSCDQCDCIVKNAAELHRHQRICKPEPGPSRASPSSSSQQVNCDYCGLAVKSIFGLRRHTRYCNALKECENSVGSKLSSGHSPTKCDGCGSVLKSLSGLRRHKRSCNSGRSS